MAKLSVVIPSRDEKYLISTIDDIFRNARGEIEAVAVIDSDKWPDDWASVAARHPNLHTIHHGEPRGMRAAINAGVASAKSRGAKFIAKFDGHCAFSEGFDETLKADCEPDWIVVPRRKRLNPETWTLTDTHKPDVDYHYLSFPDDPNDFGGPGLNGKIWPQRAAGRADYELDEEMSSQGSGWFMHTDYFYQLDLMDEANYGKFWNEFQELGLKCWLSGGRVMVNKRAWYAHWHKGKAGRGYKLPESWLQQGATFTKNWMFNDAWAKQTKSFKWLIGHFWPVPSWPDNWEEVLYTERKPRAVVFGNAVTAQLHAPDEDMKASPLDGLRIHEARYGVIDSLNWLLESRDVTARVTSLVKNNSLDIIVNNSTLTPGENLFRGKKKRLVIQYSYDGNSETAIHRDEKDWLIIGQVQSGEIYIKRDQPVIKVSDVPDDGQYHAITVVGTKPLSALALNDYLIRKFAISPQRLRGPMPIELRDFHRNDLAQLFAELGLKRGAEIGVAEGNYSEVLLEANPTCELLLVDPWHAYSDNPQNKSKEKHEFAYNETLRKTKPYPNVKIDMRYSMDAVRDVADGTLDWIYLDAHHSYPFIMSDLIFWSRKVRSGGIVAGDDVYRLDESRWGAGPMEAIYDYTRAMRINPWFLIDAHRSTDFFFVKP